MSKALRRAYYTSAVIELGVMRAMQEAADQGPKVLAKYCLSKLEAPDVQKT